MIQRVKHKLNGLHNDRRSDLIQNDGQNGFRGRSGKILRMKLEEKNDGKAQKLGKELFIGIQLQHLNDFVIQIRFLGTDRHTLLQYHKIGKEMIAVLCDIALCEQQQRVDLLNDRVDRAIRLLWRYRVEVKNSEENEHQEIVADAIVAIDFLQRNPAKQGNHDRIDRQIDRNLRRNEQSSMRIEEFHRVIQTRIVLQAEEFPHGFHVFGKGFKTGEFTELPNLIGRRDSDFLDHRQEHVQIVQLDRRRENLAIEQHAADVRTYQPDQMQPLFLQNGENESNRVQKVRRKRTVIEIAQHQRQKQNVRIFLLVKQNEFF